MKRAAPANLLTERLTSLSDPIRLRILRVLEREELSVGELASVLQFPQSTVSRHLRTLGEVASQGGGGGRWLVKRSEGTSTLYHMVHDDLDVPSRALWMTVREQFDDSTVLAEDARRLAAVLADRRLDTKAFFGRVAGEWDSVRSDLFGQHATLQSLLPLIPHHWTVADLGCGTGNASEVLAPCVAKVIAIDQSPQMLAAAKQRLAGQSNVDFVQGDLESLPIPASSVEAVVCVLVLHHLADPAAACREMARILKPGGTALVVDMTAHDRAVYKQTMGHRWLGFGVPEMKHMLTAAGLERARFQTLACDAEARGPGLFACTAYKPDQPDQPRPTSPTSWAKEAGDEQP